MLGVNVAELKEAKNKKTKKCPVFLAWPAIPTQFRNNKFVLQTRRFLSPQDVIVNDLLILIWLFVCLVPNGVQRQFLPYPLGVLPGNQESNPEEPDPLLRIQDEKGLGGRPGQRFPHLMGVFSLQLSS